MSNTDVHFPSSDPVVVDTPRCICVRLRDANIVKQNPRIVELASPSSTAHGTITTEYNGLPGFVLGNDKMHIMLLDAADGARLDRDAVSNIFEPDNATLISSYTFDPWLAENITHITRQTTMMANKGTGRDDATPQNSAVIQYESWLRFHTKIDIPDGHTFSITPPNSEFPNVNWTFNQKLARCTAIHHNCFGIGPYDKYKGFTLSKYLPYFGTHGIVDPRVFNKKLFFYIIRDDNAEIVSDRYPLTLRTSPTDLTPGMSSLDSRGSTTHHWPITAVTNNNPGNITIDTSARAAPANGDEIQVGHCEGMISLNSRPNSVKTTRFGYFTISNVTDNLDGTHSFDIDEDTTSYGTYTGGGYAFLAYDTNRSGTYVFEGDYSKWTPKIVGIKYRIYIPGWGTSLPFLVDAACWYQVAKKVKAGYFNTYIGVELQGEYELAKPANFQGLTTYHSVRVGAGEGFHAEGYETATVLNIPPGGIQDAGDPDQLSYHMTSTVRMLLETEVLDANTVDDKFGHPGAVTLFNRKGDTTAAAYWAGTENLGWIHQHAIWILQFWRSMRMATGEVRGVWGFLPQDSNLALYYSVSWLPMWDIYAHDAEPVAGFRFAALAGVLAYYLNQKGLTTLANTLIAEAEETFDRSVFIRDNADTYYTGKIRAVDEALYQTQKNKIIDSTREYENLAAAALLRAGATGNDYLSIVETINQFATFSNNTEDLVAFLYVLADDPGATAGINPALFASQGANNSITAEANSDYFSTGATSLPEYGRGAPDEHTERILRGIKFADLHTLPLETYYKTLLRVGNHVLGAGPHNKSYIPTLGERWVKNVLNEDIQRHLGLTETPGMIPFMVMNPESWSFNYTFGFDTEGYAPLSMWRNNFTGVDATKQPEPTPQQLPTFEYLIEHDAIVALMESQPVAIGQRSLAWALALYDRYGKKQKTLNKNKRVAVNNPINSNTSSTKPSIIYTTAGFLVFNAATHGASDGTQLHGAVDLKFLSDDSVMYIRASGGTQPVYLRRNANNTIEFASPGVFSCITAAVPASIGWCTILWDANGTDAELTIIHAGGVITGTNTPGTPATLSLAQNWHYGEDAAGGNRLHAEVSYWWEKAGQTINLANSETREQWYDTTIKIARDPGATGVNPVDNAYTPDVYVNATAASHGAGADSAGIFFNGTSQGTWAENYTPAGPSLPFGATRYTAVGDESSNHPTIAQPNPSNGDLLVAIVTYQRATPTSFATPTGWSNLASGTDDFSSQGTETAVFVHNCDGTEGTAPVQFTVNAGAPNSWTIQLIHIPAANWHGTISGGVEAVATGNTNDPASLTPSWGSAANLWIAFIGYVYDSATVNTYPANYTDGLRTTSDADDTGPNAACVATCFRELTAAAEDPAAFILSETEQWVAGTIAIRPGA